MNVLNRSFRASAVGLIHLYQGVRAGHLSPCRFTPSCSEYAAEAVTIHGVFRGVMMSFHRIIRCRPHGGYGFDPVPN